MMDCRAKARLTLDYLNLAYQIPLNLVGTLCFAHPTLMPLLVGKDVIFVGWALAQQQSWQ